MKKSIKNKFLIVLMLILSLVVIFPISQGFVYADTQITESDMEDGNLYTKLLKVGGGLLRSETFNKAKYATITLKGVTTANTDSNIIDLSGLTLFRFDYTTKLDLSNNNVETVSSEVLSVFPNLEELVLTNNNIRSIDLTGCYNLKRLIIDNNELTSIDLTDINPTNGKIDLSCNSISSINDITFPSQTINVNTTIDLYNNNIVDYTEPPVSGYTINLGLQGLSKDGNIEKQQQVVYYKPVDTQKIKTVIWEGEEVKYTLSGAEIVEDKIELSFDYGSYSIGYYYDNDGTEEIVSIKGFTVRTGDAYYRDYFRYYKYREFNVVPTKPSYVYVIDGEEQPQGSIDKITKVTTIKVNADEDSVVYYSVNGGDWKQGSEILLTIGGRYVVDVKATTLDGLYESEKVSIFISAAASLRFPSILIVFLIIIGAVVLFGVGFPLIRKYVL